MAELRHRETRSNRGVYHVTFDQFYQGIRVEGSTFKVHLRETGEVDMANGFYYPDIDVPIMPALDEAQAKARARDALGIAHEQDLEVKADRVIWVGQNQYHLAWKLTLFSNEPLTDWEFILDAHDATELYRYNRLTHVTGTGSIYPTHPWISSVTTADLYRLAGDGTLTGTYVKVENDEASNAYSSNHNFQYGTSSTHFDEVNVYYHVDKFRHNYVANLGSLGFTQITAHVHSNYWPGPNNAWFSLTTQRIYFGDGTGQGFNPFSREDKVIYHEYGHAIIYDINSDIRSDPDEEGAISEGVPDYFAGAHTGRSIILDYAAPAYKRDMENPNITSYSQYSNESPGAHRGGEFFSAVLWDLRDRSQIGASQADFLVFDALYRISGTPDFLEFRDGMMAADDNAYSGSHNDLIQNTFADWGIGTHVPPPPLTVWIDGPSNMMEGTSDYFYGNADGTAPYTYMWYTSRHGLSWDFMSTSNPYLHTAGPPDFEYVKVEMWDSENRTGSAQHMITIMGDEEPWGTPLAEAVPDDYVLQGNYPNPFNPSTEMRFGLPETAEVTLTVYDITGKEVANLVNSSLQAGYHRVTWDAGDLPSGIYLYRLTANDFAETGRMALVK